MTETQTVPLAEQQRILREAIEVLAGRVLTQHDDATLDALRFALADHDDPDTGCLAEPGSECVAVARARQILATAGRS